MSDVQDDPEIAGDGDQALFERIWYAERDRRIDLGFDLKLLNRPGSPVYKMSDNVLPWVAFLCLVVVGWRLAGWIGALAAGAATVVLIATTVNFAVMGRLRARAREHALSGRIGFAELWRLGAVSLRLKGDAASEMQGPAQDWRDFARRRLPKAPGGED
ncbi:MAG: hypothetical protein RIM80_12385 [Alphaproteobacteria bacterium]